MAPLPPGAVIGILGGGQLGRMMSLAAADLGYRVHVFTSEEDSPAAEISAAATVAAYDDETALAAFAEAVDVVTLEFENIPVASLEWLAGRVPVHPSPAVLRYTQDRVEEKRFLRSLGIATAPFEAVASERELREAAGRIGLPAILKTCRLGYDGKGQAALREAGDIADAWAAMHGAEAILEGFVTFRQEISVIVARGIGGAMEVWPPAANTHRHHILHESRLPCGEPEAVTRRAEAIARQLAEALDVIGLLAVEMFVTQEGDVLVNEMAPRPHNSGHWTMDASATSQFSQAIRAVTGLPLGPATLRAPVGMRNLIGDDVHAAQEELRRDPSLRLHLYGKAEARPGRKMGHVTKVEE